MSIVVSARGAARAAGAGGGMARALLLALTCAAAASAARYVDYSGVKMPAYGGGDYEAPRDAAVAPPSDDYHGHSPDAPASLDYKYEEEPRSEYRHTTP